MVSFHKALAETRKAEVPAELEDSSKKRKWEEPLTEEFFEDHSNSEKSKSIFGIQLHLDTPLPSNKWQPYLTIQSGQIHLCNTMINMKTPDSKTSNQPSEPSSNANQMSLDLDLNLTCESLRQKQDPYATNEKKSTTSSDRELLIKSNKDSSGLTRSPSWLSSDQGDHREMVATVCMRCHMLVMLCKSSPACPNCKFMHPPDQNPSKFLKRRKCSLLC